jgi:Zn-dependent protease with chaperone function
MDFQTHQDEAKQGTLKLVLLFGAGVLAIIALVSVLLTLLFGYSTKEFDPLPAIAVAAPVTLIGVGGASLVKTSQIRGGGGSYVATSMGGRPIDFNTLDPAEKQLSNVVEEIAIASGMAVPAVFVLDNEPGINAFAAGWSADNAAIGVTRGALQHLTRDELQGVIAHEFAHIRNGDTKLKTRIIGWVFGIAILTVLGRILLESLWFAPRRRSSKDDNGIVFAMMAAGIGLLIIGSVGTLFARMIQASVSRQRELLADASAVQFTRNPDGLGEALSKIGGMAGENKVRSAHAVEAGHLFFSSPLTSAFSSHPPLKTRISRLIPGWDGTFHEPDLEVASAAQAPNPSHTAGWGTSSGQILPGQASIPGMPTNKALPFDPAILFGGVVAAGAAQGPTPAAPSNAAPPADASPPQAAGAQSYQPPHLDGPTDDHISYARQLLARIPEETQNYLHTRGGAVASVLGLLASDEPNQRQKDLAYAARATGLEPTYLEAASDVISRLDRPLQLPAIDIALHSIRETPWEFQETLRHTVVTIESSHPEHDLFRWMLRRVMLRHLEDQRDTGSSKQDLRLPDLEAEAVTVFAAIAWFNSSGPEYAPGAFTAALITSNLAPREIPAVESLPVEKVDAALELLSRLNLEGRRTFVSAATAIVAHDATTTADEAELIRVVADAVRLPVPPLLPV